MRYPNMPDLPEDATIEDVFTASIAAENPTPGQSAAASITEAERAVEEAEQDKKADEIWKGVPTDLKVNHRQAYKKGYGLTDGIVPNEDVEYGGGPGIFGRSPQTGEKVLSGWPDDIDVSPLVASHQNALQGKKTPYTDVPHLASAATKVKDRAKFEEGIPAQWDEQSRRIAWEAAQEWSLQGELTSKLRRIMENQPPPMPPKRDPKVTMAMPEFQDAARIALDYKFGKDTDGNSFYANPDTAAIGGRDFVQAFNANEVQAGIEWLTYMNAPPEVQAALDKLFTLWDGDEKTGEPGTEMELSGENIGRNVVMGIANPLNAIGFGATGGVVKTAGLGFRALIKERLKAGAAAKAMKEAIKPTALRAGEGALAGGVAGGVTEAGRQDITGQEMDAGKIGAATGIGAAAGAAITVGLPETFQLFPTGYKILRESLTKNPLGNDLNTFVGRRMILEAAGQPVPSIDDAAKLTRLVLDDAIAPNAPANLIYDSLMRQGVDKPEAEAAALVNGSLYDSLAKQYEVTPEQLYRAHPFHIKVEQNAMSDAADDALAPTLAQSATPVKIPKKLTNAVSMETALGTARAKTYPTVRALKEDLQATAINAMKEAGIDPKDPVQFHGHVVKSIVRDVQDALRENTNAIGWYDQTLRESMAVMSTIHPELATDPAAQFAFKWALAVTSNGQEVNANFKLANQAYEYFKANGKFPDSMGAGNAQKAIAKGLTLYNRLADKYGQEDLAKFMNTEYKASELERITGIPVDGENADTIVKGSAILGPKIGNGFFSNLNGDFDQLTMDRWLMRTLGRWTGQLIVDNPARVAKNMGVFQGAIKVIEPGNAKQIEDIIGIPLTSTPEEISTAVHKASIVKAKRDALIAVPGGDDLRLASNSLWAALDGQKEAPTTGTERNQIRAAAREALQILRENGHPDLTMADMQATLWYPEKRLYDVGKSAEEIAASYADDAAPDYANAAAGLAAGLGKTADEIAAARAAVRGATDGRTGDARRVDGSGQPQADGASGVQGAAGPGFDPKGRKRFSTWGVFDQIRSNRSPTGESPWSYKATGERNVRRRGSVGGQKVEIVNEFKPEIKVKNALKAVGLPAQTVYEVADPAVFHKAISDINKTNKFHASVEVHPVEEYGAMRLFMSEDGKSGLALTEDGNIVSGFNAKAGSGEIHGLMEIAIQEGGRKADAFDTVLPTVYAAHGMKPVARIKWDDAHAPAGWDKKVYADYNGGEPDVVFLAYDPQYRGRGKSNEGVYVKDWDEGKALQGAEVERLGTVLYQNQGQPVARGEYDPGKRMARIFATADQSTIAHESSHNYLSMVSDMVESGNVPDSLKREFADAMGFIGTTPTQWAAMTFEQRRPFHEKFAQTFENYLRDGVAPTKQLQGIFDAFRDWLTKIYTSTDELGGNITPEARAYFDKVMGGPAQPAGPISMAVGFVGPVRAGTGTLQQPYYRSREDYIRRLGRAFAKHEPLNKEPLEPGVEWKGSKDDEAYARRAAIESGGMEDEGYGGTLKQGPVERPQPIDPAKAQATVDRMLATPPDQAPEGKYIKSGTINVERHMPGARADRPPGQVSIDDFLQMERAEDVAAYLERVGEDMGFSEAPRTQEMVKAEAADIRKQLTPILGKTQVGLASDTQLYALRSLVATAGDKTVELANKIAAGDNSAATLLAYQKTAMGLVTLQNTLTKNVRETARALAQQRYITTLLNQNDTNALQAGLQDVTDPQAIIYNAQALVAKMNNGRPADEALGESLKRRTWLEAAVEYWTASILSGPTTHIINMSANLAKDIYDIGFLHPLAAAVGTVRTKFSADQSRVYWREVMPSYHGAVTGLVDGLAALGHVIKTGESKLEAQAVAGMGAQQKLGRTGALHERLTASMPNHPDAARRIARGATLSFTALTAEDEIFKTLAYRSELSKLAIRRGIDQGLEGDALKKFSDDIMQNIPDDLHRDALLKAKELTFQDDTMGGGLIGFMASKAREITSKYPALKFIVPFITTPANVVNAGMDASILAALNPKIWRGLKAGGAEADMAAAKLAGGAIMTTLGYLLYQRGALTGDGPDDPGQRKMLEATGWQRNSIRVGDTYYSYDRLDPLATPLVTIASMLDRARFQRREVDPLLDSLSAVAAAGSHFLDLPFLTGIADLVKVIDYGPKAIARMGGKIAGGFIPFSSATATFARTSDPIAAGATGISAGYGGSGASMDLIDEAMNQIKLRLPWARDGIRPQRYWDGEIQMAPVGGALMPINPMPARKAREDHATEMLVRYGVTAAEPTPIINVGEGISVNLLDFDRQKGEVYDAYLLEVGKARKAAVLEALKDPIFKKTDEQDKEGEKPLELTKAINEGKITGTQEFLEKALPRLVKEGKLDLAPIAAMLGKSEDNLINEIQRGRFKSSRESGRFKNEQTSKKIIQPSGTGAPLL